MKRDRNPGSTGADGRLGALLTAVIGGFLVLPAACEDVSQPGTDAGGTGGVLPGAGGRSAGGTAPTGGRSAGGTAPTGGTGGDDGGTPDGSLDGGTGGDGGTPDGSLDGGTGGDASSGVDGSTDGDTDGGATAVYPACNGPVPGGDEQNVFPAGVYALKLHAAESNTIPDESWCGFATDTATLSIYVKSYFGPCNGDACLTDPVNEIVVNVRSTALTIGSRIDPKFASWFARPPGGVIADPLVLQSVDEPSYYLTVTVDRHSGGITATATAGRGESLSRDYLSWSGAGHLDCPDAPARTSPPPIPPVSIFPSACTERPLTEPVDWNALCSYGSQPTRTCASSPSPDCTCKDVSNGSYRTCCGS